MTINSEYFYGNKISDYGLENGYVDYGTLAKAFNAVLANDIIRQTYEIGYWEQISGDCEDEIFQYYIVDCSAPELLEEAGEIVFYNEELDLYVWGVTHWGTSWSNVLTNIEIVR